MDTKGTPSLYKTDTLLLSDSTYYKYIFKKTEKIVCAVFYILEHTEKDTERTASVSLEEAAKKTLDAVLATLSYRPHTAHDVLTHAAGALVGLASNVRVAQAAAVLPRDVADVLALEIDAVLRSLHQYLAADKQSIPDFSFEDEALVSPPRTSLTRPRTVPAPHNRPYVSSESTNGQHRERRDAIKGVLAAQGHATIKDISDKVSDCSEKTIQRELLTLIKDGEVIKEGERRWSKYRLATGV